MTPSNQRHPSMSGSAVFVCKSKVKYHTLKSAERAKVALAVGFKTQFDIYRCGTSKHYHLTHKNPSERIGHGNKLKPRGGEQCMTIYP